jgi:peptide/nickel transport system substrate-binding protein
MGLAQRGRRSPGPARGRWIRGMRGIRARMLAVAGGAAAVALVVAGCTGGNSAAAPGGTPANGGTAVMAEPPGATPNYIFPFASNAYISVINSSYLTDLMYRPLYWFGANGQAELNSSLSVADLPQFNGDKVTITLKHYTWSNGTPVTASDVMFWLNMMSAVGQTDWGAYSGFPANVHDITVVSPTQLTMVMNKAYNPTWFLYNDLSQITPIPQAWDQTASGPGNCATSAGGCAAVYSYLDAQAKDTSTYASSPLWSVVDGPWKLRSFTAGGRVSFVPNKSYSGPVKAKLAMFTEVPFATAAAEYHALQSPGRTKIDVGYLPTQDAPAKSPGAAAGASPLSGYSLSAWPSWGINYVVLNYQSTDGDHAAIFKQLYFRQAMEDLMNQEAVLTGAMRGYGTATVGPVGDSAPSQWLSAKAKQGDPYTYNPSQASSLLSSHGWHVAPGGVTTCDDPAKCGPGITKGSQLSFTLPYATGTQWVGSEMTQLQSSAAQVGIKLSLQPEQVSQVTSMAANCTATSTPCGWDMANWGSGWTFSPDYEPTGETLFTTGAVANSGGYDNQVNESMIQQTITGGGVQSMYNWENYLSTQLPVLWQPTADYQVTEVASSLQGVTPENPTLLFNPENWYYVK